MTIDSVTSAVVTFPAKPAQTAVPIHSLLAERWSPRAFDRTREVDLDDLTGALEAARWAPSAANRQPWSFLVVPRTDAEGSARVLSTLAEGNQAWAGDASVLIVGLAKSEGSHSSYDLGQAVAHLTVEATARGLVAHQMGGFDPTALRAVTQTPVEWTPLVVIALGHLAPAEQLSEAFRERELAPRTRRPLVETVHGATFGSLSAVASYET